MTFSIAGFCRESGQFGTAISSSSICVASRCAFVAPRQGIVLTQNVTNPELGHRGMELLAQGLEAGAVLDTLVKEERFPEWRQLQVLDAHGNSAVHSGGETLGIHATRQSRDCVAGGNMLTDTAVIDAMIRAFESTPGELAERLLKALEAALEAGGEMGPVHSAGLKVFEQANWPSVDLRVDWHIAPIQELRMIWQAYLPERAAYICRAVDPNQAPGYGVPGDDR